MKFKYTLEVEQTLNKEELDYLNENYPLDTAEGLRKMFEDQGAEAEIELTKMLDADCVKITDVQMIKDE